MPQPPGPADRPARALLLLLLLAREADLPAEQVDSPAARALVARGLPRRRVAADRPRPHDTADGLTRGAVRGPVSLDRERPACRPT